MLGYYSSTSRQQTGRIEKAKKKKKSPRSTSPISSAHLAIAVYIRYFSPPSPAPAPVLAGSAQSVGPWTHGVRAINNPG